MTLEIKCTRDMNLRCTNSNLYFVSFHVIPWYLCNVICWCTCTCCDSWAIQSFLWTNFIHTKARLFAFIFLQNLCNPAEPNSKTSKFSHRRCWEGCSLHNVQISEACLNEASILWPGKQGCSLFVVQCVAVWPPVQILPNFLMKNSLLQNTYLAHPFFLVVIGWNMLVFPFCLRFQPQCPSLGNSEWLPPLHLLPVAVPFVLRFQGKGKCCLLFNFQIINKMKYQQLIEKTRTWYLNKLDFSMSGFPLKVLQTLDQDGPGTFRMLLAEVSKNPHEQVWGMVAPIHWPNDASKPGRIQMEFQIISRVQKK